MQADRWFGQLPAPVREDIIAVAALQQMRDGELIYRKGDAPHGWLGLVDGAVKIGSTTQDGKEAVLTFMEPGSWFGEMSLFDGLPRAHDSFAYGDSTLLVVTSTDFHALLQRHPALYPHFISLHCQRMRVMYVAMDEWNTQPLEVRLARQLISLADRYGVPRDNGTEIDLRMPQEGLAQLLGVTRQRINQTLKAWERSGRVHTRYGKIVVADALVKEYRLRNS